MGISSRVHGHRFTSAASTQLRSNVMHKDKTKLGVLVETGLAHYSEALLPGRIVCNH